MIIGTGGSGKCVNVREISRRHTIKSKCLHQIDPSHLSDPIQCGMTTEVFIGRGPFSIVQLKIYRGMHVAVKQFRTQSFKEDTQRGTTSLFNLSSIPAIPICEYVQLHHLIR